MSNLYWLLFSVLGLFLIAGCEPIYRVAWVGPGTEQEFSQARSQCVRDTGGELLVTGRRELGRVGAGRSGEPDPTLFSEYQAKKTPLDVSQYKRLRFIQCMEDKGYRLEPDVVGDGVAVREKNGVGGNSNWANEG